MMSRLADFYAKYLRRLNKYWLVTVFFLIITFLVGDSSLYRRYKYNEKIRALKNEINRYRYEMERDESRIRELETDDAGLEQFAREDYLMTKEGEDLFIIEE
jgi:cell division protein FtsB